MTNTRMKSSQSLRELARSYGLQLEYEDVYGRRHTATEETILAVMRSLGIEIDDRASASELLDARRRELYCRGLPPVIVAWEGCPRQVELTLPAMRDHGIAELCIDVQTGLIKQQYQLGSLDRMDGYQFGSDRWITLVLPLPQNLPLGYHNVSLDTPAGHFDSLLISAPRKAYWPDGHDGSADVFDPQRSVYERNWGCFLPLYAVKSSRNWGAGDFTDLERLAQWTIRQGGSVVGTLPLLASYLNDPCDPSPYAPVSRLFWNEFYIDVEAVPELKDCDAAKSMLRSKDFQAEIAQLRDSEQVDYSRLAACKRNVLQALTDHFFQNPGQRFDDFSSFLGEDGELDCYARFRAATERLGSNWQQWPQRQREGLLQSGDYRVADERYHLYVQWLAHQQLKSVADRIAEAGGGLYLDLPLGVRGDSYDAWRFRETFVNGVHAGAPPDTVWTGGQNWGFPPFHPDQIRLHGYQHLRELLRRQLRVAGFLRIDHVMSLHRLLWIPQGMSPAEGLYVGYRPEELYAVFCLESHLHQTGIIGENLGTVPSEVNQSMKHHGLRHMHVIEYELDADPQQQHALDARCIGSLNTHDIPMFAAWWQGEDLSLRRELGLFGDEDVEHERRRREQLKSTLARRLFDAGWLHDRDPDLPTITAATEYFLAASPAELVLINLEDLWSETRPQNIPGTSSERPNWKRKSARSLEQIESDQHIAGLLREVNRLRCEPTE